LRSLKIKKRKRAKEGGEGFHGSFTQKGKLGPKKTMETLSKGENAGQEGGIVFLVLDEKKSGESGKRDTMKKGDTEAEQRCNSEFKCTQKQGRRRIQEGHHQKPKKRSGKRGKFKSKGEVWAKWGTLSKPKKITGL